MTSYAGKNCVDFTVKDLATVCRAVKLKKYRTVPLVFTLETDCSV